MNIAYLEGRARGVKEAMTCLRKSNNTREATRSGRAAANNMLIIAPLECPNK